MTDTFRKTYTPLTDENFHLIRKLKDAAEGIEEHLSGIKSREMSLAMTNLEQAVMWGTKAIVLKNDVDIEKDNQ